MSDAACVVASYAVNATWEIPLIACAGGAASRVLRRWGPQAQHVAWVAALLLSVVAPALPAFGALFPPSFSTAGAGTVSVAVGRGWTGRAVQGGAMLLPAWLIWAACGAYLCALLYFLVRLLWLRWFRVADLLR